MKPSIAPKRLVSSKNTLNTQYLKMKLGLDDGGCPFGTVPIRRTTKDDLIRPKLYGDSRINAVEPLDTHVSFSLPILT